MNSLMNQMLNRICCKNGTKLYSSIASNVRQTTLYSKKWTYTLGERETLRIPVRPLETSASNVSRTAGSSPLSQKVVGGWLIGCSGMVFGGLILGGARRWTEPSLATAQWPLFKTNPPSNDADWHSKYSHFQDVAARNNMGNVALLLEDFKWRWQVEHAYNTWGKMTGVAFYLPAAFFWTQKYLKKSAKVRVGICGTLLGIQGILGWYLTNPTFPSRESKSDSITQMSRTRLAAHYGAGLMSLAFLLRAGMRYLWVDDRLSATVAGSNQLRSLVQISKGLLFFTAISGALVAGLHAGVTYNVASKNSDKGIPEDSLSLQPSLWKNILENVTTLLFDHRCTGTATLLVVSAMWLKSRSVALPPKARLAVNMVTGVAALQVAIGITSLLSNVPIDLAAAHQCGSVTLMALVMWFTHELRKIPK